MKNFHGEISCRKGAKKTSGRRRDVLAFLAENTVPARVGFVCFGADEHR
ncbi:MAG: hypothetical protein ACI4P6_07435 [Candidatus Spyradosoma sp.]